MDLIFLLAAPATLALLALLALRASLHGGDRTLTRDEIEQALTRLGDAAADAGEQVTLVVVGGTALMLGYGTRATTRDVDAFMTTPPERSQTRAWALRVARELDLPEDWLNDGAKGFMQGVAFGPLLLQARGILVYQVAPEQLLAMKLGAWRGEQDQLDARVVLEAISPSYPDKQAVWDAVRQYLTVFEALKAGYAFEQLWEETYGD